MNAQVIKTGAFVLLPEYDKWVYGDIHQLPNGTLIVVATNHDYREKPDADVWATMYEVQFKRTLDSGMRQYVSDNATVHFKYDMLQNKYVAVPNAV